MHSRFPLRLVVLVATLAVAPLTVEAQRYPLAPRVAAGEYIHPFFEGWYELEDGSKVFSYGYFNRNLNPDPEYIPRGEDNFLEPAEFDGLQPEWFPVRRERGVFVVSVPPDWPADREVIWTFRSEGQLYSVPGSWRTDAMQLTTGPAAMGSDRPALRMDEGGDEGTGIIEPVWGEPRTARVNEPLVITIWGRDVMAPDAAREELVPVTASMFVHHGPDSSYPTIIADQPEPEEGDGGDGGGRFNRPPPPNAAPIPLESDGSATFRVTFPAPGNYLLRVMLDNHRAVDSSQGDQCCWTNGYVEVQVTE